MSDHNTENKEMRARSGHFVSSDRLTSVLYELIRDHVPPSTVEKIVRELDMAGPDGDTIYTNGWLASYAEDLARRIRGEE